MARMRYIKPGFFLNDQLAEIEPLGRLLFAGLWTIADREGKLDDRPKRIKAEILPYDDCNIDVLLNTLAEAEFIHRYEVDGNPYIIITNFNRHQSPNIKETNSIIPNPPEKCQHHVSTIPAPCQHLNGISLTETDTETDTETATDAHTRVEDAAVVASQEVSKATTIRNLLKSGFTEVEAAQLVTLHGEKRAAQDLDKALFAEKTGQLKGTITGFVAESLKTATGFTVKGWKPPAERAATAEAQKEREKAVAAQQKQATAAAQAERLKLNSLQDAFNRLPKDEQEQIARETIAAFEKASPFNRNLVQRYRESGESEIAIVNNHPFVTELRNAIMQKTEVLET